MRVSPFSAISALALLAFVHCTSEALDPSGLSSNGEDGVSSFIQGDSQQGSSSFLAQSSLHESSLDGEIDHSSEEGSSLSSSMGSFESSESLSSEIDERSSSQTDDVSGIEFKRVFPQPTATELGEKPQQVDVTITIDASKQVGQLSTNMHGINATTYTGNYNEDERLMAMLKDMQPGTVRFPGGDMSNMYFFDQRPGDLPIEALTYDRPWTDFTTGMDQSPGRMNTPRFYELLNTIGADGFITVNYPYARYGLSDNPVVKAASYAADWVRYDNGRTKLWEIGNETYACWEGGFRINTSQNRDGQPEYISGELYGQHARVFIDSMKAAAESIGVDIMVGVMFADDDNVWDGSEKGVTLNWNRQLAAQLKTPDGGNYADFITTHSYFLDHDESSPEAVLGTAWGQIERIYNLLNHELDAAGAARVPIALSEWNIKKPHQTSHIGAMHAVNAIVNMHKFQFISSNYFGIKDYWRGTDGDFALFGNHDPSHGDSDPYPAFFHFYYLNQILGDVQFATEGEGSDIVSLASGFADGSYGVILINKSSNEKKVAFDVAGADVGSEYYWYAVDGAGDDVWTEKVAVNGRMNEGAQKGGPNGLTDIPAYSANTDGSISVALDGYSIVYLLIEAP
ncbi:MAG: hypothetical protein OCD01_10840 [Fibrobacterales bacterium]